MRESKSPEERIKQQEEEMFIKRDYAFNKTLEEETKQMSSIADVILRKKEYNDKFKNREVVEIDSRDPRIQYF